MDILIKGMEMKDYPQSITINPDGSVIKDTFGLHRPMEEWKAVALPPHGDLVDRSFLKGASYEIIRFSDEEANNMFLELIDNAPTIVEANNE